MQLKYCSITGPDDGVQPDDLMALAQEFPFVEWAILWLPEMAGQARCPRRAWIEEFSRVYKGPHTAMHLCGQGLLDFIAGKPDVLALMSGFKRIQLNLEFGEMDGRYDPSDLIARIKALPQWTFIIQYAESKVWLLPHLKDIPNHALLFDTSAGRGVSPDSWPTPVPGHFCGYAGGINPENVGKNLDMISTVAPGQVTWIDMETGVRTNDLLDLKKVRRVLETSAPYTLRERHSA